MPIKVATWNINSVRLREGLVTKFMKDYRPDVLCLQETKCPNDAFPMKEFRKLGYEHMAINGQKGYHGVATLSRIPFEKQHAKEFCGKGDSRHVSITLKDGTEIHNFYVPAGGDEPDPAVNEKFAHKLAFVDEMTRWFRNRKNKKTNKMVLVGDLNIAPLEHDVWSHKQLLKVVSHTPVEVDAMNVLQKSHAWVDVAREQIPESEKIYTWWSYRAKDWAAANKGRRLDHIWVTPALSAKTGTLSVLKDVRGWDRPSDHCPVMMDLKV